MTPAVAFRVLGSRALLLGSGNPDALQNVNTTELPDGALCWVIDQQALYVLNKTSTAPAAGTSIVVPDDGPGRWFPANGGAANTPILPAAITPSSQWGSTPVVAVASGSNNLRGAFDIQAGSGPSAGWTIDVVFSQAFATAPFVFAQRTDANNPPQITSMDVRVSSRSTTGFTLAESGSSSPIGGTTYSFSYFVSP